MTSGADVQVENGNFTRVHNRILEELASADLSGREARCLFFLFRMTYGHQAKEIEISLSLWAEGTSIDKRHVKPIIDRLVERKIVRRIEGRRGRGNTAIYGFNKYYEQWDGGKKVPSTAPIKKVPSTVPFSGNGVREKVPSTVPEKVPSTVPNKEKKQQEAAADAFSLVTLAHHELGKFAPSMSSAAGKNNLLMAEQMIERYGYDACAAMVAQLRERNSKMIRDGRQGIKAPLPYLRTILEDSPAPTAPATTAVDFVMEDIR